MELPEPFADQWNLIQKLAEVAGWNDQLVELATRNAFMAGLATARNEGKKPPHTQVCR